MRRLVKIQDFSDPVKRYRSVALITDRVNNLKTCADEYPFIQSPSCVLKQKEAIFISNLVLNNKVVPKSAVNPDFLEPFHCKGLFTTRAIKQSITCRPLVKAACKLVKTWRDASFVCVGSHQLSQRNTGAGLIGIGLPPRLRAISLESFSFTQFQRKVVLKSAVNPDFLEPLNCKGLFATYAINQTTCRASFFKVLYEWVACLNDKVYEMYTFLRCLNLQPVVRFDWRWSGPEVVNFFINQLLIIQQEEMPRSYHL